MVKLMVNTFDGFHVEWRWDPYFRHDEPNMRCNGTGELIVDPLFFDKVFKLREWCGFPFNLASMYRAPVYNDQVSSTGLDGPHTKGAIDIKVSGAKALTLLGHATTMEFKGIGISQKGSHSSRFIHLDNREHDALWSY